MCLINNCKKNFLNSYLKLFFEYLIDNFFRIFSFQIHSVSIISSSYWSLISTIVSWSSSIFILVFIVSVICNLILFLISFSVLILSSFIVLLQILCLILFQIILLIKLSYLFLILIISDI